VPAELGEMTKTGPRHVYWARMRAPCMHVGPGSSRTRPGAMVQTQAPVLARTYGGRVVADATFDLLVSA